MAAVSGENVSLNVVARQLGLVFGRDWAHHGAYFINGHGATAEAELHKYYNAADLLLSTSLGEGWGLSTTEALACGTPVAIPNHTSCREIMDQLDLYGMGDRFVRLPLEEHVVVVNDDNSRLRRRVNVEQAVQSIEFYYHHGPWQQRPALKEGVRKWLSWERIAAEMYQLLKGETRTLEIESRGIAPASGCEETSNIEHRTLRCSQVRPMCSPRNR
jgi:glycosyltransferase involved in cell wall biosynthesis